MEHINNFFEELQQDINNSKTDKNLKFLNKKAKRFVDSYLVQPISSVYKKTLLIAYRKSVKLIKSKSRNL